MGIYYYLNTLLELLKIYFIVKYGCGIAVRKKEGKILIIVVLVILYGSICYAVDEEKFLVYVVWLSFVLALLFKEKFEKKIIVGIGFIGFCGMLDDLSLVNVQIINALSGFKLEQWLENILASVVTIIFLRIVYVLVLRKTSMVFAQIGISRLIQIFLLGFLYSAQLALIWDRFLLAGISTKDMNVYLIFLVISVSAYYQLILLMKLAISNRKLQERDQINRYFFHLQESQYLYLKNTEQETRKFRHDVKSHMSIIKNLSENGKTEEIGKYIEQVWGKLEMLSRGYHVNNDIVDTILNQYAFQCKHMGIRFDIKGHLPEKCMISSYDICTLFSNILQNAYEASVSCSRKEIKVRLRFDCNYIYIEAENFYQKEILMSGGIFSSSKADTKNHGFGMANIKECIQKYHGDWHYETLLEECGEKKFLIQIMVSNEEAKNQQAVK